AVGAGLVVAGWLLWWWRRWARSRAARRRVRGAQRAEREATRLLAAHGYIIEQLQPTLRWSVIVDGRPHPVLLRADAIVSRQRRRYVADIKSGARASQLAFAPTRRQLLEYRIAYDVEGVLLVDMERSAIHQIEFGVTS
ncbi:MAG: hypothetical protein AAGA56_25915, partial [Myxococcota bacterium]